MITEHKLLILQVYLIELSKLWVTEEALGCAFLEAWLFCGKGNAFVGSWLVDVPRAFVFNSSRIRSASLSSSSALGPWPSQASITRC